MRTSFCNLACACLVACSSARTKGELDLLDVDPRAVDDAARPRKVALLLGVNRFDDPFWGALRFAEKDASDLARTLAHFDDVKILEATTAPKQLLEEVRALADHAPRAQDTVLIYVSAHGTLALDPLGTPERVLVLSSTEKRRLRQTGLLVDRLTEVFEALPSRRKVLILATCHSGGGKSLLIPEVASALAKLKGPAPISSVSRGSLVLSAADLGQPAREDDALENDVYTHFFVQALARGADANGDGAVSATEAHDYARRQTYEFTDGRQVPTVHSEVAGADPVLLTGRVQRPGMPVLYSYAMRLAGLEVRVNGRPKGALPGNVVLEPGQHDVALTRPNGEVVAEQRLDLVEGQRLTAEMLIDRSVPRFALGLRGGGFAFFGNDAVRAPIGGFGLGLRVRDWPFSGIDPVVDFTVGIGNQNLAGVAQSLRAYEIGAGFGFAFQLDLLRLYFGPHLAYLIITRDLDLVGVAERQRLGTFVPGGFAGAALSLGRFELLLEARAHYLSLLLDDETRATLSTTFLGGVGVHF